MYSSHGDVRLLCRVDLILCMVTLWRVLKWQVLLSMAKLLVSNGECFAQGSLMGNGSKAQDSESQLDGLLQR